MRPHNHSAVARQNTANMLYTIKNSSMELQTRTYFIYMSKKTQVTSGDGDQHLFQSLSSFPVAKAAHDNFAEFVCANATFAFGGNDDEEDEDESSSCDLSSASKMSFLRTASVKGSVEDGFFGVIMISTRARKLMEFEPFG